MSESESFNHWQISCESLAKVRVLVDSVELKGVRSILFKRSVGNEPPIICLEVIPETVNVRSIGEETAL